MDKNTQLTRNFKWGEFWCHGQEPPMEYYDNIAELAHKLQILRDWFRKPIIITSGWDGSFHDRSDNCCVVVFEVGRRAGRIGRVKKAFHSAMKKAEENKKDKIVERFRSRQIVRSGD